MAEPTFGQRLAATIQAELGILSSDQEQIVANIIDREHATSQGKLNGFALEHTPLIATGAKKHREALFDALCGCCGIPRDGMTKPMARSISVSLNAIMAVMPSLTSNEIILRSREYKRKHPTWELTPGSLAKHWGSCATRDSLKGLLDEPPGWRSRHALIFPESESGASGAYFATMPWEKIGRVYQEKIIRWMGQQSAPRPAALPHAD